MKRGGSLFRGQEVHYMVISNIRLWNRKQTWVFLRNNLSKTILSSIILCKRGNPNVFHCLVKTVQKISLHMQWQYPLMHDLGKCKICPEGWLKIQMMVLLTALLEGKEVDFKARLISKK